MKKESIKEKIRKQILMGGGETLVDAIYLIFENHQEDLLKKIKERINILMRNPSQEDDMAIKELEDIQKRIKYNG